MPDIDTILHLVTRTLETSAEGEAQLMVELLLFPELSTLANKDRKARAAILDLAEELLAKQPADEINRRTVIGKPEIVEAELKVEPARRSEAWREAVVLSLQAVVWEQGVHVVASVPALGIAVIAPDRERLESMLGEHALAALKRGNWNSSLLRLAMLARGGLALQTLPWSPRLDSAAERWKKFMDEGGKEDPVQQLCSRMEGAFLARAFGLENQLQQLARLLTLPDEPSVLVMGTAGAGKTALIQEMARRRNDFGLSRRAFHRSSGTRLIAGASGFGMWQQRCKDLVEAAREQKLVLYLGNLFELMNVGQSSAGSESIASFLRPYLVRREVQIIVECTDDQRSVIEKQDPRLLDAFRTLRLEEPTPDQADAILLAASLAMGGNAARFSRPALQRLTALHRRYLSYSAFPGTPLRFMKRVHENIPADRLVEEADVYAAFSRETGMPRSLLDPEVALDLETTRQWFHERVQGQPGAVDAVVSVVAQIKAGMARPGRPLGSLLFIGPTGTGKTEMAKALAQFLFQSAERMIRLDMSEYGQPWSAQRLVSGSHDGREGLLTSAIREQPFSVLLLDEFEKADPAVFDLFLQLLGEARLTDAAGRTADFGNCVVIMTSNLGAQDFARGRMGFHGGGSVNDATDHFTGAVQKALRPEMFNRIDRIIPYQPLTKEVVVRLTRREIETAALRQGFVSTGLRLSVSEELVQYLAREGYDPRYGARPLKRRVATHLLAPIAARMAEGLPEKSILQAGLDANGCVVLEVVKPGAHAGEKEAFRNLRDRLYHAASLREAFEKLRNCTMVNVLQGKLRMLTQQQNSSAAKSKGKSREWAAHDPQVQALTECLDGIEASVQKQMAHEERLILALHGENLTALNIKDPLSMKHLEEAALSACKLWQPPPESLILLITGKPGASMMKFAALYRNLAEDLGATVQTGVFYKQAPARLVSADGLTVFVHSPAKEEEQAKIWEEDPGKLAALALWISGGEATLFLRHEAGQHVMKASPNKEEDPNPPSKTGQVKKQADQNWVCRLDVFNPDDDLHSFHEFSQPATEVGQPAFIDRAALRRQYDAARMTVREGTGSDRIPGTFQKEWLLNRMRATVLKEALS